MDINIKSLSTQQLLKNYAMSLEELRLRRIVRTSNNPVGDYAEWLVANQLGLELEANSKSGYDAIDLAGVRFQIKSRRLTRHNSSRQLSAIRNLKNHNFDYLIAVLFNEFFEIETVVKIPQGIISKYARFSNHVNAHILIIRDNVINDPLVEDLTSKFID